jgi:hypothetical protein
MYLKKRSLYKLRTIPSLEKEKIRKLYSISSYLLDHHKGNL